MQCIREFAVGVRFSDKRQQVRVRCLVVFGMFRLGCFSQVRSGLLLFGQFGLDFYKQKRKKKKRVKYRVAAELTGKAGSCCISTIGAG